MICKFDYSKQYIVTCPTGVTGALYPNSSYVVSGLTPDVTGSGTYSSYLSSCDAEKEAADLALLDALTKSGQCSYVVTTYITGDCPYGSANPTFYSSGTVTSNDTYQGYLAALAIASGMYVSLCSDGSAPTIISQPIGLTVLAGDDSTFLVSAIGTNPLFYQWTKNGLDIDFQTGTTYTITNTQAGNAGLYAVRIWNQVGTVNSNSVTLIVSPSAPRFTLQPTEAIRSVATDYTFSGLAKGTDSISYEWFQNTNTSRGVGTGLYLSPIVVTDSGNYFVTATNSVGSTDSNLANLNVGWAPTIAVQPSSQTFAEGNSVTFSVTANGSGTLTYQWRKGGVAIGGATNSTYNIPSVLEADSGNYDVVITNSYGSITSNIATLTAGVSPTITVQPAGQTKAIGQTITFTVTATGTATLTYQWKKDGVSISGATSSSYSFTAVSSSGGDYTVVISNTFGSVTSSTATLVVGVGPSITLQPQNQSGPLGSSITFTVVASGPSLTYQWKKNGSSISGATNSNYTISSLALGDVAIYAVVVTNTFGNVTSSNATLTVGNGVGIFQQPIGANLEVGDNYTMTVGANGTAPISYQWKFNSSNAPGTATNSGYAITNAQIVNSGNYYAAVSNAYSSLSSNTVAVNVAQLNRPTGLAAVAIDHRTIGLTWFDNSAHEDNYLIYRKSGIGGTYATVYTGSANLTSYNDTLLNINSTYYYKVRCSGAGRGLSDYSEEANATTANFSGQIFNIDFNGASGDKVGYGATGFSSNDFWNYDSVYGIQPSPSLFSNSGISTISDGTLPGAGTNWIFSSMAHYDPMMAKYAKLYTSNVNLGFSNVPIGTYDLYIFGHGPNSGDCSRIGLYYMNTFSGYKTTSSGTDWNPATLTENYQYVKFANMVITGAPSGFGLVLSAPAFLNGLQLMRTY